MNYIDTLRKQIKNVRLDNNTIYLDRLHDIEKALKTLDEFESRIKEYKTDYSKYLNKDFHQQGYWSIFADGVIGVCNFVLEMEPGNE